MKKWVLILLLLLLLGILGIQLIPEKEKDVTYETVNITKNQIYQGNLILVNKNNPVHQEGIPSDVKHLSAHMDLREGYSIKDDSIQMSQTLLAAFSHMVNAAKEDGVHHFLINSSFRTLSEQKELYQIKGPNYAMPAGYSEHNLGQAVDIGSTQTKMNHADEGKWLKNNAWKY
jgi:D-alanyl-D-alanine carboxypeptidase